MSEKVKFSEMDVQLAMMDLNSFFGGNKGLSVTTLMSLKGVPIKEQNQWVKEKLLLCENKSYWESFPDLKN